MSENTELEPTLEAVEDAEPIDETPEPGEGESGFTRSKREAALDNEGEIAADDLEELLDIADLDGDIDTYTEGGRAHV
ncbi:MAG: protein jag, partial [Propionicimonas sp.]